MNFITSTSRALRRVAGAVSSIFKEVPRNLTPVDGRGWGGGFGWHILRDFSLSDWQADTEIKESTVAANWCVFACKTLIAGDIGKLRLCLMAQDSNGIWSETQSSSFSPVLRKPNRYQIRQKLIEQWILSKLTHGNAYVLMERDQRGVVIALYVLDPTRVQPLVSPDGSVYYQLMEDDLAHVPTDLPAVPASEIIHDTMWCLFHPLCGISPLYACGLAAMQGTEIQNHATKFFKNSARPSGILTAPGQISDDVAKRLKENFETGYSGVNRGKVAVLGDGLKFESMTENAVDSEIIDQLKLTAGMICATFHVPPHMVGAGPVPTNNNVEALEIQYYSKALQGLIESIEALLDEGLGLVEKKDGRQLGTYFEIDDLLKMDSSTLTTTLKDQVGAGISTPNEARRRLNLPPVEGGNTPYLQVQNYALSALAKRDNAPAPSAMKPAEELPKPEPAPGPDIEEVAAAAEKANEARFEKLLQKIEEKAADTVTTLDVVSKRIDHKETADLELEAFAAALVERMTSEDTCV